MTERVQTPAERHEAILRLLAHRHDHLPEPGRRDHASSGFVHRVDHLETCPDCFGEQPGRVGCETCRGTGTVRVRRDRDPYAVNVVQRLAGHTGTQHDQARERDRAIDRLTAQLAPRPSSLQDELAEAERRDYGWVEARRRMWEDFDFAALELALERLRLTMPDTAPGSSHGLAFLDRLMPEPVRAPQPEPPRSVVSFASLRERNRRVRELVLRDGMPTQWVAGYVGLSVSQVNRIVAGSEAA